MIQAAVVQFALEPLAVELRDIAVPEIGDVDVLLRVGAVSVCGSIAHHTPAVRLMPGSSAATRGQ